jgi:23S rRNA pseudouridine1911/1915/1917 synthase
MDPVRLDAYLSRQELGISRAQIRKMIEQGLVLLNGAHCRGKDLVSAGDHIQIVGTLSSRQSEMANPRPFPLDILYEDADLLVVNKPPGLVSHPGIGTADVTLLEAALYHFGIRDRHAADAFGSGFQGQQVDYPGIVHRLDKDTSGVMVLAKNAQAHAALAQQFREKTNLREYIALLDGCTADREWEVENYLIRDPADRLRYSSLSMEEYRKRLQVQRSLEASARYAKTSFKVQAVYADRLMLVSAKLFTGRTHQIRIHARDMRIPVVGDPLYGRRLQLGTKFNEEIRKALESTKRQMLHALSLGFVHPSTSKSLLFQGKLPSDFERLLESLKPYRSA